MRLLRHVAVLAIAGALIGCTTGHDFAPPAVDSVTLGKTTRDEIVAKYGSPYRESTAIVNDSDVNRNVPRGPFDAAPIGGTYSHLFYFFQDRSGNLVGNGPAEKGLGFDFWNGKLIAFNFLTNHEASNFDETKVSSLAKGVSTEADAIRLFGEPTGEAAYPGVQAVDEKKLIYSAILVDTSARRQTSKRLEILLTPAGKVQDYRFGSNTGPMPVQPGGGATTVPIFIPKGK